MTFVTRVSTFFLFAIACILIVFSIALYEFARYYLYRQFDEQLNSSLHTLVAAVEVEDDDVKWEPLDHKVTLGSENGVEDIRWVVCDEAGRLVDRSRNLTLSPTDSAVLDFARRKRAVGDGPRLDQGWRLLQFRLSAPHPKAANDRDAQEHAELIVTVARSTTDVLRMLAWLATLLVGLSIITLLLAALVGRWFCRKAIAPVLEMARSARSMRADDTSRRLPVASTGDEIAELGQSMNGLLDMVFRAYERQRRFSADAAHQLRTPLTVLQGQIDVALRRPRRAEEYRQTIDMLKDNVRDLSQVIESLLFLATPQEEQLPPDLIEVELSGWLAEYAQRWKDHVRADDITFQSDEPVWSDASPALLSQLVDNLVSNAIKYSEPGTPVMVGLRKAGDEAILEVSDRGIGIAADDIDSVFEPLFRSRQARQSGAAGTGLGLAIASRIADVLGGRLSCESSPDQGSRFFLTLPSHSENRLSVQARA